jgi:uncharacterized protein involved in outer membrane biogenesis
LVLKGNRYTMDDLSGKIGSTDVSGAGAYVDKKPRPLLTGKLHSRLLNMADLGPMIGVQTKGSGGKPALSQAETRSRPAAKAKEKAIDPNHILPAGSFDGSRLQKIDAEVTLDAARLIVPQALPLESLRASLRLYDSILDLDRVEFGFAGGAIVSQVRLDARDPVLRSEVQINLQKVRVDQLVPKQKRIAQGAGFVGAALHLKGMGNSIADAAAKADGRIVLTIANGRVSNLLDAASGLNGGKVLGLLVAGDREIEVNCGGAAFDVRGGRGTSSLLVVDTEQTQILGAGEFDLREKPSISPWRRSPSSPARSRCARRCGSSEPSSSRSSRSRRARCLRVPVGRSRWPPPRPWQRCCRCLKRGRACRRIVRRCNARWRRPQSRRERRRSGNSAEATNAGKLR